MEKSKSYERVSRTIESLRTIGTTAFSLVSQRHSIPKNTVDGHKTAEEAKPVQLIIEGLEGSRWDVV